MNADAIEHTERLLGLMRKDLQALVQCRSNLAGATTNLEARIGAMERLVERAKQKPEPGADQQPEPESTEGGFPKFFTSLTGFRDGSAYLRCDSESAVATILADGSKGGGEAWTLSMCRGQVTQNNWKEITATQAAALLEADHA